MQTKTKLFVVTSLFQELLVRLSSSSRSDDPHCFDNGILLASAEDSSKTISGPRKVVFFCKLAEYFNCLCLAQISGVCVCVSE